MTSVSETGYNSDMTPTVHVYRGSKHVFIGMWNLHLKKLLDAAGVTQVDEHEMPVGALAVTDADAATGVFRLNACKVIVYE